MGREEMFCIDPLPFQKHIDGAYTRILTSFNRHRAGRRHKGSGRPVVTQRLSRLFRHGASLCQSPAMMLPKGTTSSTTSARP